MAGFFHPYASAQDALAHIGPFADGSVGRGCGICFSDGRQLSVLRRPSGTQHLWLTVLSRHVSLPHPAPKSKPQTGMLHTIGHILARAMEMYADSQMQEARANQAMADTAFKFVDNKMWQPTHAWLLKHKLLADTLGVAADVVGVIAAGIFVATIGPELGVVALVVGGAAAVGSVVLAGVDGAVWGFEIAGDEETAKAIEGSQAAQWARIIGTLMTLPDMAVGGVRALKEIGTLPGEIHEASTLSRAATDASVAQRARAAKVSHPAKHPGPVQKHLTRAKRLAAEAQHHAKQAAIATTKLGQARISAAAAYGATPTSAALIVGAPPEIALTEAQRTRDAKSLADHLAPAGGMPRDVRLEMKVSSISHPSHRR